MAASYVMFALVVLLSILYAHSQVMLKRAYRREERYQRLIEAHLKGSR